MDWFGALGWVLAAVLAVALYWALRRAIPQPPRARPAPQPPASISQRTHVQVLQDVHGQIESERTVRGAPPDVVWRPHGKSTATKYPYLGRDGDRYIFRAER